jgi:hypothetical protein
MATSAFNKFNSFTNELCKGTHNFSSHTFKVALTNTAPVATNSVLTDITQIAAGGGYTAGAGGGYTLDSVTLTTASGVAKVTIADEVITASGGSIASFRYAVVYNDTATNDPLIGWVDYGSSVSPATGETFTIDFDGTNGVFTVT